MYPNPLSKGDKVAILCASTPTRPETVARAEDGMKRLGFDPLMMPSCYAYHGHLAGPDEMRLKDLHDAFSNPEIKGIICLKGGSGSTRLLNKLDYDLIAQNPKVFIGFSDVTALNLAIYQKTGLMTFHGPMATSEPFLENPITDFYTVNSFLENLMTLGGYSGELKNPAGETLKFIHEGIIEGPLVGGNLSLLVQTLGSPYEIDCKGKILFIEDVGEHLYIVDKMLTALSLAGKFEDCVGVIFGTFTDCLPELKKSYGGYDLSLDDIIQEVVVPYGKPIVLNLRAGHNFPQPTLPMGKNLLVNSYENILTFTS